MRRCRPVSPTPGPGIWSSPRAPVPESFTDTAIASKLQQKLPREQWTELLGVIENKLTGRNDRDLFDAIQGFAGQPHQLSKDAEIKVQLKRFDA
jgi:hypothetical protein